MIVNAFQKIISKGKKPNKIWVDQGGEFYNNLFKRFFKINNIEMWCDFVIIIKTINLSFCLSLEIQIIVKHIVYLAF